MPTPPDTDLPADPAAFYAAASTPPRRPPPSPAGLPSALERLGPSPFPRTGFPFLGFLATLYDQIAAEGSRQSAVGSGQ